MRYAILFVVCLAGCVPLLPSSNTSNTPPAQPPVSAPSDPYQECAAIRKYFHKYLNDPASLEIIDWGERHPVEHIVGQPPNMTYLYVHFRSRNQFGAIVALWQGFECRPDGRIYRAYEAGDY